MPAWDALGMASSPCPLPALAGTPLSTPCHGLHAPCLPSIPSSSLPCLTFFSPSNSPLFFPPLPPPTSPPSPLTKASSGSSGEGSACRASWLQDHWWPHARRSAFLACRAVSSLPLPLLLLGLRASGQAFAKQNYRALRVTICPFPTAGGCRLNPHHSLAALLPGTSGGGGSSFQLLPARDTRSHPPSGRTPWA